MPKEYGILIKNYSKKNEERWYATSGKRMQAMAKIRGRMVDDPDCIEIRFIEREK